jgi:hypothetical protein
MIDYFALALTHGLLTIAAWRLMSRGDLDSDPAAAEGSVPDEAPVRRA